MSAERTCARNFAAVFISAWCMEHDRFQLNTFQIGLFPNQRQLALSDAFVYLMTLSRTRGPLAPALRG